MDASDVGEVLQRPESSLEEELFKMRDFMLRVSAVAGQADVTFTAAERRQILEEIIKQPVYDADGLPVKSKIPEEFLEEMDDDHDAGQEDDDDDGDDTLADEVLSSDDCPQHPVSRETNEEAADNEDAVMVSGSALREEINEITKFKGVELTEAVKELVDTLSGEINQRGRRLEVARAHIGASLVPDEKNVSRLSLYERPARLGSSSLPERSLPGAGVAPGQVVPARLRWM